MISVSRRKPRSAPISAAPQAQPLPAEGLPTVVRPPATDKRTVPEKPGAGRTTPLGRRVESPERVKTAGPSGQRSSTQDQKQHTNK